MKKKFETFTISEFMAYTSEDVKLVDKMIGHIKRNKKAYMQLVFIVAIFLYFGSQEVVVEAMTGDYVTRATNKITNIFEILYRIVLVTVNGAIGLGAMLDIGKNVRQGTAHEALRTTFNYLAMVALANAIPFLIKMVVELFSSF